MISSGPRRRVRAGHPQGDDALGHVWRGVEREVGDIHAGPPELERDLSDHPGPVGNRDAELVQVGAAARSAAASCRRAAAASSFQLRDRRLVAGGQR